MTRRDPRRVAQGDWQTPPALARAVISRIARWGAPPSAIVEPTCGIGAFLEAAADAFPAATLHGFDVSARHVRDARARLGSRGQVKRAEFFATDWRAALARLPAPIWLVGNPPWVTSATLGAIGARNLPPKANVKRAAGLDALTGKSNFDISEWMLLRLLDAARERPFVLAMLCKTAVARRVIEHAAAERWGLGGELRAIDARAHFGADVEAVLLCVRPDGAADPRWPVYPALDAPAPSHALGVVDGVVCGDVEAFERTRALTGPSTIAWRSGVKHDCARVMELAVTAHGLVNGLGEPAPAERDYVFPLLKGADLAHGAATPRRAVIVTQRHLRDDTRAIAARAPALWRYLEHHADALAARKSRIYQGQPPFAMFGVGAYAFAPYKVATSGLAKRLAFHLVGPVDGQPVMLDDTAYFLPCDTEAQARALVDALSGPAARAFFAARVFWDAKRPVTQAVLSQLCLEALLAEHARSEHVRCDRAAPADAPPSPCAPTAAATTSGATAP